MTARLTAGRSKVLYSQMVNEIIPTTMRTCIIAHSEKGKTLRGALLKYKLTITTTMSGQIPGHTLRVIAGMALMKPLVLKFSVILFPPLLSS